MGSKTPVTILQELCCKSKQLPPFYEELPEEINETSKIFRCLVTACGRKGQGRGSNKKIAKHDAAANLLEQMSIKTNFVSDAEEEKQNAVLRLLDMCIAQNWPLAKFEEIQASGPSHCPEFTCRCTLSTLMREATAQTKKQAKQKVALSMLHVIEEMQMIDPEKLKVMQLSQAIDAELEDNDKIVRTYMDYKKLNVKKPLGVKLCDRHTFFVTLDPERVEEARKIFIRSADCVEDKIRSMLSALKLKFHINREPSYEKQLMSFELEHDNYDCFFVEFEEQFWLRLAEFFVIMLDIPV